MNRTMLGLVAAAVLASCSMMSGSETKTAMTPLEDGQLPLPVNYKSWPKFLSAVQRPDANQVREIYVNPIGYQAKAGEPFAHGTIFVMENYALQMGADGKPATGSDGKLVKGTLQRVFVMAKGPGYASQVVKELKTGDWAYTSYDASGNKTADPIVACRACHVPLANKDFVARYDEYFAARAKGY